MSQEMVPTREYSRLRRLTCSCCGSATAGRQWWNRDNGYGLCDDCIEFATRGMSAEEVRQCYGERGVHYGLGATPPAGPGKPPTCPHGRGFNCRSCFPSA